MEIHWGIFEKKGRNERFLIAYPSFEVAFKNLKSYSRSYKSVYLRRLNDKDTWICPRCGEKYPLYCDYCPCDLEDYNDFEEIFY